MKIELTVAQIEHFKALIVDCDQSASVHAECGMPGAPYVALKIWRKARGKTMRVMLGVTGRVVQWGNAISPSVVMVDAGKLKGAITAILDAATTSEVIESE